MIFSKRLCRERSTTTHRHPKVFPHFSSDSLMVARPPVHYRGLEP